MQNIKTKIIFAIISFIVYFYLLILSTCSLWTMKLGWLELVWVHLLLFMDKVGLVYPHFQQRLETDPEEFSRRKEVNRQNICDDVSDTN